MAKRKTKAEIQAATDKVNAARRERYAAKHGNPVGENLDSAPTTDKTPPPITDKKEKAATTIIMVAVDRGVLPLETIPPDLTDAEIIAAALATGHVRYNDILFLVNANNYRATRTLIVLK